MSKETHRGLAAGRWQTMTLAEQLGNIGSEVGRAFKAKESENAAGTESALRRALELFDLTIADPRWAGRRKEILRAREVFCDLLIGKNQFGESPKDLDHYFLEFGIAARRRK